MTAPLAEIAMSDPDHHCPGCGLALTASPRYPWRLCGACLDTATDADGRPLEFANASASGGLVWRVRGTDTWHGAASVRCRVLGRPVRVHEARFGGVVAEPVSGPSPPGAVDLA